MTFNDPQMFWWMIPAASIVLILAVRAGKKRSELLKLLLGKAADDPDAVRLSKGKRHFRIFLLLLVLFLLIAAAARPYWTSRMIPFSQKGRDIMVLFDVSKSMLASDIAPSRLEHAKYILRSLVQNDPQDRFGLAAFAGTAYTVCPLTSDPVAFEQYIGELSPDLVPVGGTNLEKALSAASQAFKAAGGNNRAIVLFTDGDELEGDSSRILAGLKQKNTPLFIIGLGDPAAGAPVPDGKGGFQRDSAGKLIVTKLAESKLIQAAQATGGMYIRSTVTDTGIAALEKRIRALDAADQASGKRTIPVEKFPLALIAAAVGLLLYLVMSERPHVRNMVLFLLPVLLICGAAENPAGKQLPAPAAQTQEEKLPEDAAALYNLARSRQLKGEESAIGLYEQVLKKSENRPDLQSRSFFNIGTGVHRGGQEAAASAYSQVQAQQLDPALEKLKEAEKRLAQAEELYCRSLSIPEAADFKDHASGNLQLLAQDRKRIEELKKKIEELKKQQQQARKDAENAKQKNQQQNQQQNRQQNQQQNRQQNQQQNQQQNRQQNQQQNRQQSAEQSIRQAQKSSQELQKQADDLKQHKLSEQAQKAQQELQKASQEKDAQKKQQHLDEALKALGAQEQKNQQKDKQSQQQKPDSQKPDKPQEKLPAQPQMNGKEEQQNDRKTAEQLLQMLNDEEKQRREDLRKMRQMRRVPVRKDW